MHRVLPGTSGEPETAKGKTIRQLRLAAELENFYRQLFLPLVRRATWKHNLSKEDARDLVQDAFVLAVVKLKVGGNGRIWLMRTVDQLAANFRRKGARHARLEAQWLTPTTPPETEGSDFDLELGRLVE